MCDICKAMLTDDHNQSEGPFCQCGRFRLGLAPDGNACSEECYHCFNDKSELEVCPLCGDAKTTPDFIN